MASMGERSDQERHFKVLDKEDFTVIYKTYIRPHLDYCVQAWSPHWKKDIECLFGTYSKKSHQGCQGTQENEVQREIEAPGNLFIRET